MAVELASAFVSIIPTTKGIQGQLEKELSPLAGVASKAGDDSGRALGSSFTGASGGLKSSLGEAEGHFGKFKAGATSALDSVGVSAGMLKVAGAGALVEFGVKAVGAFTETAKSAIDLSTSTGLAVEEASRWIAVGDDFEVSAGALATGLGKVSKTMDSTKWEKYGIDTRDAAGNARSANDILLDSFDVLSKVTNRTEQARIGQELFGKGYQSLTPILGHTRAEYEKMLGTVEKGQVITDEEAAKAERFRLAEDQLGDALKDVTIMVGEQVAALAPLLEILSKVIGQVGNSSWTQKNEDTFTALSKLNDEIRKGGHDIDFWVQKMGEGGLTLDQVKQGIHDATLSTDELKLSQKEQAAQSAETARETSRLPIAWEETRDAEAAAADAALIYKANTENTARAVKQNLDEIIGKWDVLTGNVDADKSWLTLQGTFDDVKQSAIDAFTAAAEHTDDAEAKGRAYQTKILDIKQAVKEYAADVMGVPTNWASIFKAEIDRGSFDLVENQLAILTRNRQFNIQADIQGSAGFGPKIHARGGFTDTPWNIINDQGPELVRLPTGSWVATAAATRSLLASNSSMMQSASNGPVPPITVNNNGRDIGIGDLNQVLAMARLRS